MLRFVQGFSFSHTHFLITILFLAILHLQNQISNVWAIAIFQNAKSLPVIQKIITTPSVGFHQIDEKSKFLEELSQDITKPSQLGVADVSKEIKSPINSTDDNVEDGSRKTFVVKMMREAWDTYKKYAFGDQEVNVIYQIPFSTNLLGGNKSGITIIDSIDTLYIMGMMKEYEEARKWIIDNLKTENYESLVSLFEFNIRVVGGLLSIYYLSHDKMFLEVLKPFAERIADHIPDDRLPNPEINFKNGNAGGSITNLAECGTLHLELYALSAVFNNTKYMKKAQSIRKIIFTKYSNTLPANHLVFQGNVAIEQYSLGAYADSFYEYLIKSYVQSGRRDESSIEFFKKYLNMLEKKILLQTRDKKYYYLASYDGLVVEKMETLACFAGGMYALAALNVEDATLKNHYKKLAKEITHTCRQSYLATKTHLGPEIFLMSHDREFIPSYDSNYILRPELVESYFYLWRTTKDKIYREWAWNATLEIYNHCRHQKGGFSGIKDVNSVPTTLDGLQQSFFLAETLKYLYLIHTSDDVLPLSEWVFNTEAHPLPISGAIHKFVKDPN